MIMRAFKMRGDFLPYANSLDPDKTRYNFLYILGVNRLWGEKTSGGKITRGGGERPGGKRFWGETTRGGDGLGRNVPDAAIIKCRCSSWGQRSTKTN